MLTAQTWKTEHLGVVGVDDMTVSWLLVSGCWLPVKLDMRCSILDPRYSMICICGQVGGTSSIEDQESGINLQWQAEHRWGKSSDQNPVTRRHED